MVSLNFPNSPSDGDIYESFRYNADLGVWKRISSPGERNITVSTMPPANPLAGDIWYDSTEGFSYIYYEDEDSAQWVQFGLTRNGADGADGADGTDGVNGSDGIDGADGADGQGVPTGGITGQALVKSSEDDYDTEWADLTTSLEQLSDVSLYEPVDGQALVYDATNSEWVAGQAATPVDDVQIVIAGRMFG